jgi:hypothetical protein
MAWQDRIPACFGDQYVIFAGHWADEDRAKKAIKEAKAAGASRTAALATMETSIQAVSLVTRGCHVRG